MILSMGRTKIPNWREAGRRASLTVGSDIRQEQTAQRKLPLSLLANRQIDQCADMSGAHHSTPPQIRSLLPMSPITSRRSLAASQRPVLALSQHRQPKSNELMKTPTAAEHRLRYDNEFCPVSPSEAYRGKSWIRRSWRARRDSNS